MAKDGKKEAEKQVAKMVSNKVFVPPKVEKGLIKEEGAERQELSLTEKAKLVAKNFKDDQDPIFKLEPPTKKVGITTKILLFHRRGEDLEASVQFRKKTESSWLFRGKNFELEFKDSDKNHGTVESAIFYYKNNGNEEETFGIKKKLCLDQLEIKAEIDRIFGLILDYVIYGQEPTPRELFEQFDLEKFYESQIKNQVLAKIEEK